MEKVLEELKSVRPELLSDEGKRLFNAIMKIADQRDELRDNINKAIDYIEEKGRLKYNPDELIKILEGM